MRQQSLAWRRRNAMHPECDMVDCSLPAEHQFEVQYLDYIVDTSIWYACDGHRAFVWNHLKSGRWSGGVVPHSVLEVA